MALVCFLCGRSANFVSLVILSHVAMRQKQSFNHLLNCFVQYLKSVEENSRRISQVFI